MTISGTSLIELAQHTDERGSLVALAANCGVPFEVRRVYFIQGCPTGAVRAEHAISAEMVLVAVTGSVVVDMDNGEEHGEVVLNSPRTGLYVSKGIWIRLRDFSTDAVLLVVSPELYENVTYFETPSWRTVDEIQSQ